MRKFSLLRWAVGCFAVGGSGLVLALYFYYFDLRDVGGLGSWYNIRPLFFGEVAVFLLAMSLWLFLLSLARTSPLTGDFGDSDRGDDWGFFKQGSFVRPPSAVELRA